MTARDLLHSVEAIALLWAASLLVVAWELARALRRVRWRTLHRCEGGAAYSLAYVLTFPFYLLVMCVLIQTTLILIVKLGTQYAAYAAARSAIVWQSVDAGKAEAKAWRAAINALAPFADSRRSRQGASTNAELWIQSYRDYTGQSGPREYLRAKYGDAERFTQIAVQADSAHPRGDVAVTLTYDMPLQVPVVGRILGRGRQYRIESRAVLPNEGAFTRGPDWKPGIRHEPR